MKWLFIWSPLSDSKKGWHSLLSTVRSADTTIVQAAPTHGLIGAILARCSWVSRNQCIVYNLVDSREIREVFLTVSVSFRVCLLTPTSHFECEISLRITQCEISPRNRNLYAPL